MPSDLAVEKDTTLLLDETQPEVAESFQRVRLDTLDDLVSQGLIKSGETLGRLLEAAKSVTAEAVERRETYVPAVLVPGTRRPDLRRFGSLLAAVSDVHPLELNVFWRAVRAIDPSLLTTANVRTSLRLAGASPLTFSRFAFNDVTVEAGSTLEIAPSVEILECRNLIIRKTGRILVLGSSMFIKASSIQGEA